MPNDPLPVFRLQPFDGYGNKDLFVECSAGDLQLTVDWDDVDHYATAVLLEKALRILNDHWNDSEYPIPDCQWPESLTDAEADKYWTQRYDRARAIMEKLANAETD